MAANILNSTYEYVKILNARVTKSTIREKLNLHPHFPTLLSISDVLKDLEIDNIALEIHDVIQLEQIETPFMAYLNDNKEYYSIVKKFQNNKVEYTDEQNFIKKVTYSEFAKKWSGIILVAEPDENITEKDYNKKRVKELIEKIKWPFLILSIVICWLQSATTNISTKEIIPLTTKLLGIIVCYIIFLKEVGINSSLINNICKLGSTDSCDDIISSNKSKIFDFVSWNDLGIVYFITSILYISSIGSVSATITNLLSFSMIVMISYSLYYQIIIVKKICVLCCIVQFILFVDFVYALINFGKLEFNLFSLSKYCIYLFYSIAIWTLIKSHFAKKIESKKINDDLTYFKRNYDLFKAVLTQQSKTPKGLKYLSPIISGKELAINVITVITNPNCSACKKLHFDLNEIKKKELDLKFETIFVINDSIGYKVVEKIYKIQENDREKALDDWFLSDGNFEKWNLKYHEGIDKSCIDIGELTTWHKAAGIEHTPIMYFNGYSFPSIYTINHLETFLKVNKE